MANVVRRSPSSGIAVRWHRYYPIGPVIEGYSVDEAASVLGVPKGRVWELLARGILAGTPEDGGGMRVYLQGRPMEPIVGRPPEGRPSETDERRAPNGNGGEHGQPGFEASPFRELLTEFRSLTERYGQALLALGEARGEVASLRTRVELLEARVDLRLPSAPPLVQWSPPAPPQAAPQAEIEPASMPQSLADEPEGLESGALEPGPPEAAPATQAAPADEPMAKTTRSRRRKRARSATEGFAEALARAQDPTAAELPGGQEAQAAFNEPRDRLRRESLSGQSPEPGPAPEDSPEAMGFDDVTAPAQEVELDSFLADEELGGGLEQAALAEVVDPNAEAQAEPIEHLGEIEEGEPSQPPSAVEEAEPMRAAQAVETDEPGEHAEAADLLPTLEVPEQFEADAPSAQEPTVMENEPVAEATPEAPAYSHEWDEPDWIAEEDVDWGTGESTVLPEPVAMGESAEIGWDELPAATAPSSPGPTAEGTMAEDRAEENASSEALSAFLPINAPEPEQVVAAPSAAVAPTSRPIQVEEAIGSSPDPSGPPAAADMGSANAPQPEPPTSARASEEELMWLGDEFRAGPSTWGAAGRATTIPKPAAIPASPDVGVSPAEDEALSRLAVERGWDDDELRAIRSLLAQPGRPARDEADLGASPSDPVAPEAEATTKAARDLAERATPSVDTETREEEAFDWEQGPPAWNPPPMARPSLELPGAVELDQAMAAFEVGAWSKESAGRHDQPTPEPAAGEPSHEIRPQAQPVQPPASPEPASTSPTAESSEAGDTDWLRGRRGPAANAYRRLRRLFP